MRLDGKREAKGANEANEAKGCDVAPLSSQSLSERETFLLLLHVASSSLSSGLNPTSSLSRHSRVELLAHEASGDSVGRYQQEAKATRL